MGSLRVGHDCATSLSLFTFLHWRTKWQPFQCSCLENPRDGGAWWAAVCGVTQSRTRLKRLSSSSSSSPLGLTGLISLLAKGLSRVFSSTPSQDNMKTKIIIAFWRLWDSEGKELKPSVDEMLYCKNLQTDNHGVEHGILTLIIQKIENGFLSWVSKWWNCGGKGHVISSKAKEKQVKVF